LRRLLEHCWDNVPFYREWMQRNGARPGDIRSAQQLAALPLVSKLEVTRQPERFAAGTYAQRDGLTLTSSGTSGFRRQFRHDTRSVLETLATGRRQRVALAEAIGRETGYREAVLNREESTAGQIRRFLESRVWVPRSVDLQRLMVPPSLPFPEVLRQLNEFAPTVLRGYGSYLGALCRWILETASPWRKPRAITYGGDAMTAEDRRMIEQDLGIPVLSSYQTVEALRIGFECHAGRGFHISLDQVALRVEGGQVVLTNLVNYAMPVLNYAIGDLSEWDDSPCPCGRTLPRLTGITGRAEDLLWRNDGSAVMALTALAPLQAVPGVARVQLEQREPDDFLVRVIWQAGRAGAAEELVQRLRDVVGDSVRVEVLPVEEIAAEASGKVKSVISRVTPRW
jgi:phenylacetate-CoA ligase